MEVREKDPGTVLVIRGKAYEVVSHPAVQEINYTLEGRKAFITRLKRVEDEALFAFKEFKQKFRDPNMVEICNRLKIFKDIPGLEACERVCLVREIDSDLLEIFPDANYAVLMPWIKGNTWTEIILKKQPLDFDQCLAIAGETSRLLAEMEARQIAHTDIAGGNIIINLEEQRVFLVDLEDLCAQGFPPPQKLIQGTPGYQHKTSLIEGQWCLEGDRFTVSILLSEILAWHDQRIRLVGLEEQFFDPQEIQDPSSQRYQLLWNVLRETLPQAADLLMKAWESKNLVDCPSIKDWARALKPLIFSDPLEVLQEKFSNACLGGHYSDVLIFGNELLDLGYKFSIQEMHDYNYASRSMKAKTLFEKALMDGDDAALLVAYNENLLHGLLSEDQLLKVEQARRRMAILPRLRRAIAERDDKLLLQLYDQALMEGHPDFTPELITALHTAETRHNTTQHIRSLLSRNSAEEIRDVSNHALFDATMLEQHERRQLKKLLAFQTTLIDESLDQELSPSPEQPPSECFSEQDCFRLWLTGQISERALNKPEVQQRLKEEIKRFGFETRVRRIIAKKDGTRLRRFLSKTRHRGSLPSDLQAEVDILLEQPQL
jgi:serine/threonine protein kinase